MLSINFKELFRIGIGPSSSHTVGPMRAALMFRNEIHNQALSGKVDSLLVVLQGSLATTGVGHRTPTGIILGLAGYSPEEVDSDRISEIERDVEICGIALGTKRILFKKDANIVFDTVSDTPVHPNTLTFSATDVLGQILLEKTYYSIGGGFVVESMDGGFIASPGKTKPYCFSTGRNLLALCYDTGMSIAQIVRANETYVIGDKALSDYISKIEQIMTTCVERGLNTEGTLPGGLGVKRRAKHLSEHKRQEQSKVIPTDGANYASMCAIAVSEENAAGGQVITAPTNGAAGVIPAVLMTIRRYCTDIEKSDIETFFLTAFAIGSLIKVNASISGAEVGCQGEVGSASAMAAGGLAAVLHGTPEQILNAAEIALEHHLGMTCDPMKGLVQIPCIERNAFGAVKAINAANLALMGDGSHMVSFDQVIDTMYRTGRDMRMEYKETSKGGLALHIADC